MVYFRSAFTNRAPPVSFLRAKGKKSVNGVGEGSQEVSEPLGTSALHPPDA